MALKHPFCQCDDPGPGPCPGPGPDPGPITLKGDVTGDSDATVVERIQGVPVDDGTPTDGQVLAFDEADGKARWVTPGGGGGPIPLGGDLDGTSDDATVVGIQGTPVDSTPPADGDVLTFDAGDGKAKWQASAVPDAADIPFDPTGTGLSATDVQAAIVEASGILAAVEIPLPASSFTDATVYTAPTSKLVEIFAVKALLVEPMTGAGTVTLTMGATAGGDGYVIAQPITSASTGLVVGHTKSLATLGARFPANAGYVAALAPGDEIVARLTASGEVLGGKLLVIVEGRVTT